MEEDSREILSPLLDKPVVLKQFELLEQTVKDAQKRIDYTVAHDPDVLKAIEVVERFLRRKGRVCYGGQAINSLLPKERQFYDMDYTVPDYDFFSPAVPTDVDELVSDLEREGFTDVNKKVGMHEGTMKVFVNFVPVADISEMHPSIFKILHSRAKKVNGILYCDADFLRMLMYLELSRPRGEVGRWKKVYERLTLLNASFPVDGCQQEIRVVPASRDDRRTILTFCTEHKRVLMGPEFIEILEQRAGKKEFDSIVRRGGPVVFFSDAAVQDAEDLRLILGSGVKIHKETALTDQLFSFVTLKRNGAPVALIFHQESCQSYVLLRLLEGGEMRIGSPDLYLYLYYSLLIFGKKEKAYFDTSLDCLVKKIYTLLKVTRNQPTNFLPAFGLKCSGQQKGIATLLREKAARTDRERKGTRGKKVVQGGKRMRMHTRKRV